MTVVAYAFSFSRRYYLTTGVPLKQLEQQLKMKHNMVKNPNWREANQLAFCKRSRRILPRDSRETNKPTKYSL